MSDGWIKLHRKIDDSEISIKPPHVREIFLWLLRRANHHDNYICKRGQCIRSIKDIQEGLKWYAGYRKSMYSKSHCEYALNTLRNMAMIETAKTTRGLLITICNFDIYQDNSDSEPNNEIDTTPTRNQQTTDTINKNVYKNVNNNNNTSIPPLTGKKISTQPEWKKRCTTFEEYKKWELEEYHKIINDTKWILERRGFHKPIYKRQLNITETIRKAHIDYWGTEQGYKKIKSRKGKTIDWKSTWNNALTMRCNQVWEDVETDNLTEDQYTVI